MLKKYKSIGYFDQLLCNNSVIAVYTFHNRLHVICRTLHAVLCYTRVWHNVHIEFTAVQTSLQHQAFSQAFTRFSFTPWICVFAFAEWNWWAADEWTVSQQKQPPQPSNSTNVSLRTSRVVIFLLHLLRGSEWFSHSALTSNHSDCCLSAINADYCHAAKLALNCVKVSWCAHIVST